MSYTVFPSELTHTNPRRPYFFESFRSAEGDFELSNLKIIQRSSTEGTKILR